MDEAIAKAIRDDFLAWSGGFEPESDYQIYVYVDLARPADTDEEQVRQLLRGWMAEEP